MLKKILLSNKKLALTKEKDLSLEICMLDQESVKKRLKEISNAILMVLDILLTKARLLMCLSQILSLPSSSLAKSKLLLPFTLG